MALLQNQSTSPLAYVCPVCKLNLVDASYENLKCNQCDIEFPRINESMPILVENSGEYITGERHFLSHDSTQLLSASCYYLDAAKDAGIRNETLRELGQGLQHNSNLLNELATMLPDSHIEIEEHGLALGADLFAALRKDWSGSSETEQELQLIFNAIDVRLQELDSPVTLVLGAGTGRMLCKIDEKYSGAYGIDLSAAMGTAFAKLTSQRSLKAYLLHQGNFLRASDECELIEANRELSSGTPHYAIADASALPFADSSFDAIVSNYFTDMLPLSMWLPEVKRVLKPDGRFIHFGPIGYAFPQISEHYAVDQLPVAFAQFGLKITEPEFIRSSFYGSTNRLNRFDFDNLLFSAEHL